MVSSDEEAYLLLGVVESIYEPEKVRQVRRLVPHEESQLDRRLILWDWKSPVNWNFRDSTLDISRSHEHGVHLYIGCPMKTFHLTKK